MADCSMMTFVMLSLVAGSMAAGVPGYYFPDNIPREESSFNTDFQGIGTVSGVDVDADGRVLVFHRANRPWLASTFKPNSNELSMEYMQPIQSDAIFILDPNFGRKISSFGANLFNVPHGITVDKEDNIWVTDVGRHQVLRIPMKTKQPDLELGVKFEPGSDDEHFCKPTDVAVATNGDFFVSDGYCNSRVMKFSRNGTFLAKWGTATNQRQDTADGPDPFNLNLVHSITLVEDLDIVCVADREHMRAMCYNAGLNTERPVGSFNRTLIPGGEMGKVFAIHYNEATKTVVAASETSRMPYVDNRGQMFYPARAYTYGLDGKEKEEWAYMTMTTAQYGPSLIHDLTSTQDGMHFYLADMTQRRVLKYSRPPTPYFG